MNVNASVSDCTLPSAVAEPAVAPAANADGASGLRAHFVFDSNLKVLGRDDGAAWLTDASWSGIRIHKGFLEVAPRSTHAELRALAGGEHSYTARAVAIRLDHPRLHAEYSALLGERCGRGSGMHLLTVMCGGRSSNYIAIAMRLGLSPAEAGLIDALCTTSSLAQHATQRRVCLHTVRSQMKSVLRKLGVHTQLEAVRLMLRIAEVAR